MANELKAAEGFLYGKLHGRSALVAATTAILNGSAPRSMDPPYVIYSWQGSIDVMVTGANRIAVEPLYLVRIVGRTGTFKDLEAGADEIDAALHQTSGSYGGYRIASCVREDAYSMIEDTSDVPWRSLGGYYRLYVSIS